MCGTIHTGSFTQLVVSVVTRIAIQQPILWHVSQDRWTSCPPPNRRLCLPRLRAGSRQKLRVRICKSLTFDSSQDEVVGIVVRSRRRSRPPLGLSSAYAGAHDLMLASASEAGKNLVIDMISGSSSKWCHSFYEYHAHPRYIRWTGAGESCRFLRVEVSLQQLLRLLGTSEQLARRAAQWRTNASGLSMIQSSMHARRRHVAKLFLGQGKGGLNLQIGDTHSSDSSDSEGHSTLASSRIRSDSRVVAGPYLSGRVVLRTSDHPRPGQAMVFLNRRIQFGLTGWIETRVACRSFPDRFGDRNTLLHGPRRCVAIGQSSSRLPCVCVTQDKSLLVVRSSVQVDARDPEELNSSAESREGHLPCTSDSAAWAALRGPSQRAPLRKVRADPGYGSCVCARVGRR